MKEEKKHQIQKDGIVHKSWVFVTEFDDGERGHEPRNAGSFEKLGKAWEQILQ